MPAEFKDSAQKSGGLPWRDLSTILRFPLAAAVIARMSCPKRLYQPTVLSCIFFQLFEYEFLYVFSYFLTRHFWALFFSSLSVSLLPLRISCCLPLTLFTSHVHSLSISLSSALYLSFCLSRSLSLSPLSFSVSLSFPRSLARSLALFFCCLLALSLSLILSLSS